MKKSTFPLTVLAIAAGFALAACDFLGLGAKGLVTYYGTPGYANGVITLRVEVQGAGYAAASINVPWEITLGTAVVTSGVAVADEDISGVGFSLVSETVTVDIDEIALSGKTIQIALDPDDLVTAAEYTSPTYVDLYKVVTITIP